MLYRNLYIENAAESSDIRVTDGKFEEIAPHLEPRAGEEVVDFGGKLALPPFIESHVHLDTCLTAGEPKWNMSGTLIEGIETWSLRKETLSKEDVKRRVNRVVRMYAANGIQHIRTHVDVTDPTLIAMEAMIELREELKDFMNIQIVAFPQEGIESFPNGRALMENAVKMGADVVGAIPHFEFTREYSVSSLNYAVELAEKYNQTGFMFQEPEGKPKYFKKDRTMESECDGMEFNDFTKKYWNDLHHNTMKCNDDEYTFMGCYVNPRPQCLSERVTRDAHGEIFISL